MRAAVAQRDKSGELTSAAPRCVPLVAYRTTADTDEAAAIRDGSLA
jgi:hypothetical protein